ncbi:MAG: hypothetical protein LBQ76_01715 [Candidatus Fibromonas sp.]|jgi:hypothetical protein|nr:hypothetical protein [Candidatus Fibromonas sp.]
MKKVFTLAAAFALFATTQAFAIAGVGVHYIMNTGSLKGNSGAVDLGGSLLGESITINQEKASGLQGLGFKAWIDFLPYIDIEGTLNIAATEYKTSLVVPTLTEDGIVPKTIPLSYKPDAPYNMIFERADPLFGVVNVDLSVTYPFDLPIIRPYIGAGVSYFASIPIVNASLTQKMINHSDTLVTALSNPANVKAAAEIGTALARTLQEESYTTGIGGHLIAGFRIKVPIIPIAAYANGKYYFGGNTNDQFTQGFVLEVGGGFAL